MKVCGQPYIPKMLFLFIILLESASYQQERKWVIASRARCRPSLAWFVGKPTPIATPVTKSCFGNHSTLRVYDVYHHI